MTLSMTGNLTRPSRLANRELRVGQKIEREEYVLAQMNQWEDI